MLKQLTLLLLFLYAQISPAQVAAIYDYSYTEKIVVLIGPQNVDRFCPGQAATYIERYTDRVNSIESDIPRVKARIEKLQGKRLRNKTKMNGEEGLLEIYYLQLELLETFIDLWTNHEKEYLRSLEIINANVSESDCYNVNTTDGSLTQNEIEIEKNKKGSSLTYYEYIDSSYLGIAHIFDDTDMEYQLLSVNPERLGAMYDMEPTTVVSNCAITKQDKRVFIEFSFDEERNEYYNKVRVKTKSVVWQVVEEKTGAEILLTAWEREECK